MNKINDKFGVDFTFISSKEIEENRLTGSLAIFTADILDEIANQNLSDRFILIINSIARPLIRARFPDFEVCEMGGWLTRLTNSLFRKQMIYRLRKYGVYNHALKKKGISKVWFPYMIPENVNHINVDYVGTCHDLMQLEGKQEAYRQMFLNAKDTVVISGFVKQQIMDILDIAGERIDVIPNAISLGTRAQQKTKPIPELVHKKYLLDVNGYSERKNTLTMIAAFNRIRDAIDYDLVLCGGYVEGDYYQSCVSLIERLRLSDRVHMFVRIPDEERNWLFQNCEMCITPSENEGFGRTPIEAAVCLKPVISTRATSLEEVTCGLVHYYDDPRDDEALANLILEVIAHPDSPQRLRMIRDTYVARYAPSTVIGEYMDMFERSFSK